jgi:very-short-patch-repair endonuclease
MGRKHRTKHRAGVECGFVGSSAHVDRIIGQLAANQRGVVSRRQLLESGVGSGAVDHRLATGRLHRIRRGVYLVGHTVPPRMALEVAAVLSCGTGAVLSHRTAAQIWRLLGSHADSAEIDVTTPGRDPGAKPGIRIHRTRALDPADVRRVGGLPITAPARTLVDLAGEASLREVEQALAEAEARHLVRRHELTAALTRVGRHRGATALRKLLSADRAPALTRSEAEERLLALLRSAQLPQPDVNVRLGNYEVDFLWREQGLVIEVDGFGFHSSRLAFERDRSRDAELQAQGWRVIRVTWRQIVHQAQVVVARIAAALATHNRAP